MEKEEKVVNASEIKDNAAFYDSFKTFINRTYPVTIVAKKENGVLVSVGKYEKLVPFSNFLKTDKFEPNAKFDMLIHDISDNNKKIELTRTHGDFVSALFEKEVREVFTGLVKIVKVGRIPGFRTKIAVASKDPKYNPCSIIIGKGGQHIKNVAKSLPIEERIDVINFDEDIAKFISEAVKPGEVVAINVKDDPNIKEALVVIKDNSLGATFGKKGINLKAAELLTGYRLRPITEKEAHDIKLKYIPLVK